MKRRNTARIYARAFWRAINETGKRGEQSQIIKNFAALLARKGLTGQTGKIIKEIFLAAKKSAGIIDLKIITARAFPKNIMDKFAKEAVGRAEAKYQVNPRLLGGIIIKTGNKIYDASLRAQLNKIRKIFNS